MSIFIFSSSYATA